MRIRKTVTRLTITLLQEGSWYKPFDAQEYLYKLYDENLLPEDIIKKVGKEGFTGYNHNLLMRLYRDIHPEPEEQYENKEITYSEEEKQLEISEFDLIIDLVIFIFQININNLSIFLCPHPFKCGFKDFDIRDCKFLQIEPLFPF